MDDKSLFETIANLYDSVQLSSTNSDSDTTQSPSPKRRSNPKRERIMWTQEEDDAIVEAVKKYGFRWRAIAREVGTGSDDAIRNRVLRMDPSWFPCHMQQALDKMKRSVKKIPTNQVEHRPYTLEEDLVIIEEINYCQEFQFPMSWKKLAEGPLAPRTAHSIRNRAYRILAKRERGLHTVIQDETSLNTATENDAIKTTMAV